MQAHAGPGVDDGRVALDRGGGLGHRHGLMARNGTAHCFQIGQQRHGTIGARQQQVELAQRRQAVGTGADLLVELTEQLAGQRHFQHLHQHLT